MPRTSFGYGTPITPEYLNAVAYPQITGLPQDGHLDLLTNDNFLNQPGSVVYDYYRQVDRLKASQFGVSGLTVDIKGFTMLDPLGNLLTIPGQTVNVPDNAISWLWFNDFGQAQVTNYNPPSGIRSAMVTTGSGLITQITDLRYDYLWIPNPSTLAVFGGNSTLDYTAPNSGITVLGGVLNCRNFTVPLGATIEVDRTLTVRASGVTTIAGTIRTKANPVQWLATSTNGMASDSGIGSINLGNNNNDPLGVAVTNRDKPLSFNGFSLNTLTSRALVVDKCVTCTFTVTPSTVTLNTGTSGAVLTINSAGPVRVNGTAVINCSATSSATPTIANGTFSTSFLGLGASENWSAVTAIVPPSGTAGTFVLQSATSIVIDAGASISARGANKAQGVSLTLSFNGSSVYTTNNYISVGGGGGGAVHFQAPTVSSSPSASILTTAGNHTVVGGELVINGIGSSGNGFIASTSTLPTNGLITTVLAAPIEF